MVYITTKNPFSVALDSITITTEELQAQAKKQNSIKKAILIHHKKMEKAIATLVDSLETLQESLSAEYLASLEEYKKQTWENLQAFLGFKPQETSHVQVVKEIESISVAAADVIQEDKTEEIVEFSKPTENKSNEFYEWVMTENPAVGYYFNQTTFAPQAVYIASKNKTYLEGLLKTIISVFKGVGGQIRKSKRFQNYTYELKLWGITDLSDLKWLSMLDFKKDIKDQLVQNLTPQGDPLIKEAHLLSSISNRYFPDCLASYLGCSEDNVADIIIAGGKAFKAPLEDWQQVKPQQIEVINMEETQTTSEPTPQPPSGGWVKVNETLWYNEGTQQAQFVVFSEEVGATWLDKLTQDWKVVFSQDTTEQGQPCVTCVINKDDAEEISTMYEFANELPLWGLDVLGQKLGKEPVSYIFLIRLTDNLLFMLGWGVEQSNQYISKKFKVKSRPRLEEHQLEEYAKDLWEMYQESKKNQSF